MGANANFKRQHVALLEKAGVVSKDLTIANVLSNAHDARLRFSELLGMLKVHLAMEDKTLYPRLIASKDPKIAATANQFQKEMGGLAKVVIAYHHKWLVSAINKDPTGYIAETKHVITQLKARIQREESRLFPLVDAAS